MMIFLLTGSAIIGVNHTIPTLVALRAETLIRSVCVPACSAVSTGRRHYTFVDVLVAESASIADRAGAGEVEEVRRR